jgi:hypothetical protein
MRGGGDGDNEGVDDREGSSALDACEFDCSISSTATPGPPLPIDSIGRSRGSKGGEDCEPSLSYVADAVVVSKWNKIGSISSKVCRHSSSPRRLLELFLGAADVDFALPRAVVIEGSIEALSSGEISVINSFDLDLLLSLIVNTGGAPSEASELSTELG